MCVCVCVCVCVLFTMLYTLNECNSIWQLYLRKTGRKEHKVAEIDFSTEMINITAQRVLHLTKYKGISNSYSCSEMK